MYGRLLTFMIQLILTRMYARYLPVHVSAAQHVATPIIILNYCEENFCDQKSNHEIRGNIVPRNTGAIQYHCIVHRGTRSQTCAAQRLLELCDCQVENHSNFCQLWATKRVRILISKAREPVQCIESQTPDRAGLSELTSHPPHPLFIYCVGTCSFN